MRTYACDYLLPHSFTQNMEPARLSHRCKDRPGGKLIVAMDGQNYSSIYEELFKPLFPEGKKSSRRGFDIHSYRIRTKFGKFYKLYQKQGSGYIDSY